MGSIFVAAARGCSAGKVESPVAESVATGLESTIESNLGTDEVQLQIMVTELHQRIEELQKRIKNQDEQFITVQAENQELIAKNLELQNKLQTMGLGNSVQPDLEAIRDRVLNKLKMGRQSPAGKVINTFIKEVRRSLDSSSI